MELTYLCTETWRQKKGKKTERKNNGSEIWREDEMVKRDGLGDK